MLTPEQITSIRTAAGATPTPPTQGVGVSLSDRLGLNTAPDQNYLQRTQSNMSAGADTAGQGFMSAAGNIGNDWNTYAKNIQGANPIEQVLHGLVFLGHTAGNVAGATGKVIAGGTQAAAAPVTAFGPKGNTIGDALHTGVAQPMGSYIQQGVQNVQAAHPGLVDFLHKNPDIGKGILDLLNTVGLMGGGKVMGGEAPTLSEATNATKGFVTGAKDTLKTGTETTASKFGDVRMSNTAAKATENTGPGLLERAKNSLAESNVSPQTQVSAERLAKQAPLQGAGAARETKPIEVYNEFASQQDKHLADIKHDPAISIVGSRIGDAFKDVVRKRQEAGRTMSSELEGFANKPIDVSTAQTALSNELSANNLTHNAGEGELAAKGQTKMSAPDQKILEHYANELHELGPKPTAADLDAFLGRLPNDIKGLKATNGINFKTNAERIISSNMNMLRDSLTSMSTPAYKDARTQYADLSNFVKEGAPFLGKITQSGDFAKDASIAKSAVQSVLNNGKKDWLLKLEEHTGYPALDEATLALQAMKDSGDFKGNSLLDLMTKNGQDIPTTPKGLIGRLLDWSAAKGKDMMVGSPADQTRQYLQSLEKTKKVEAGAPKDAADLPEHLKNNYKNFPRDTTLTGKDADIQEASILKYLSNQKGLVDDYLGTNGKVANTDEARKFYADVGYNGTNSAAVQEAASALNKDAFRKLLENPEKYALLYAGGSGTGKTSVIRSLLSFLEKDAAAILDGNLSTLKTAVNRIEETLAANKTPHIVYVYRDPVEAWTDGVIKRMKENASEGGRLVPLSVFLQNHAGSYEVVKQLMKDGIQTTLLDNSLGKGKQALMSVDKFNNIKYDEGTLRSTLEALTKKAYDRKEISREQLDALLK